jgi:DNA polymerase-1
MPPVTTGDKKLFLLDGYALIYRAYFAFVKNPRINSKGKNTSASFGFTNLLLDLIKNQRPSHIAVVFDPAETPSERVLLYEQYKAHREAMPEDIREALPDIKKILEAFGIPLLVVEGYEADDVIGTLSKKAEAKGFYTYMVTSDKDYGQLVTEKTRWYKPGRMGNPDEVLGIKEVCEKFSVQSPEQVIDLLGLMGDSADNIPGIPGVGEKTAVKYLQTFGSLEGLLENVHTLTGKAKERVEENMELARVSKVLATICTDVAVELDEEALAMSAPNPELLGLIFSELEFRTLGERVATAFGLQGASPKAESEEVPNLFSAQPVLGPSNAISQPAPAKALSLFSESESRPLKTIADKTVHYLVVDDINWQNQLVQTLLKLPVVAFDTETTSLEVLEAELVGFAFAASEGMAWYIPCPPQREETLEILRRFTPVFQSPTLCKVGQNLKYDVQVLANYQIAWEGPAFDTMLAHYLINPESRHNLDYLSEIYLQYSPIPTEALLGPKGKNQKNMRDIPQAQVAEYCCEDVDVTLQLYRRLEPELQQNNASALFEKVEMPLFPVLAEMERTGIRIDTDRLGEMSEQLAKETDSLDKSIQEQCGVSFNTSSPRQLGEVLFNHLKLDSKAAKTRTGQYATNEEVLQKLLGKHPVIESILALRELQKLKNTYVDALPALINPLTGRVHTHFNQTTAATGRLSSSNPNLQNIPIRTTRGQEIRLAFIPANDDFLLLCADYSQVELRIIAALSGDPAMIADFKEGLDIHTATAARVFGVPVSEVDKAMRSKAKMVNFGIIYGISAFGLAQRLAISRNDAKEIITAYFEKYPGIKQYMDNQIERARKQGYVETLLGRRRYLKDIHSANQTVRGFAERNAINAPIQGSSADIIKLAMISIAAEMRRRQYRSKLLLQVHDELVFDAHIEEAEALGEMVAQHMRNAFQTSVPLEVSVKTGKNWLEAH